MLLIEGFSRLDNCSMLIGYAHVSTDDQDFALQEDALKKAGCKKIYYDKTSGAGSERKGLREALDYLRDDEDTLVVWRLDRLGRSLKNLIELMNLLEARGIGFKSLQESIDTMTSGGKLIFHIFGALAEFERNLIRERTMAGLAAARARGKKGGRHRALDFEKTQRLYSLYDEANADGSKKYAIKEICEMMGSLGQHSTLIWEHETNKLHTAQKLTVSCQHKNLSF
jgi:DNA invertase Pin-like site-specific DNA recombinase